MIVVRFLFFLLTERSDYLFLSKSDWLACHPPNQVLPPFTENSPLIVYADRKPIHWAKKKQKAEDALLTSPTRSSPHIAHITSCSALGVTTLAIYVNNITSPPQNNVPKLKLDASKVPETEQELPCSEVQNHSILLAILF